MSDVRNEGSGASPLISIGLPVYNGEGTIEVTICALLSQTFVDFELIISDNASDDNTESICCAYAGRDSRIRYIRQPYNIGAAGNFMFVLTQARGRYYMWAADDDLRTSNFLAENLTFLEENPSYVASTCPNCFEGDEVSPERRVSFSIEGDLGSRYLAFLHHSWQSHGIFYSLMRTDVIRQCEIPGQSFTAADWAIDLFLASRGAVHRTEKGLTVFGRNGISSRSNAWQAFRTHPIELLLPFYKFSRYALRLMKPLTWRMWLKVFMVLFSLNFDASVDQARTALYAFYCRYFKSTQ